MYMKEALLWRQTTHAFIRACGKSGSFGADARKCPAGIVIKEPFKPGCICVRGMYVRLPRRSIFSTIGTA